MKVGSETELYKAERADASQNQGESWTYSNFPGRAPPDHAGHGCGPLAIIVELFTNPDTHTAVRPHRDKEVTSWVPIDMMRHGDQDGSDLVTDTDHLMVINVGETFWHEEFTRAGDSPLRMLQMLARPYSLGLEPNIQYEPIDAPVEGERRCLFGPEGFDVPPFVRNQIDPFDFRLDAGLSADFLEIEDHDTCSYAFDGVVEATGTRFGETENSLLVDDAGLTFTAGGGATIVTLLVDPSAPVTRQGTIGRRPRPDAPTRPHREVSPPNTLSNTPSNSMPIDTVGIHHIMGIVHDVRANIDFYATTLGLHLIKRTVNFSGKFTRHLLYGDETGSPGTTLMFFPYPAEEPGRPGAPQVRTASLVIPPDAADYWANRPIDHSVEVDGPFERLDGTVPRISDPDGTDLEPVAGESSIESWGDGPVPAERTIRGIHGVTFHSTNLFVTVSVLDTLGFNLVTWESDRVRYRAPGNRATVVDPLDRDGGSGREDAGSIHHVAVHVGDEAQLYEWHDLFRERGYDMSQVKDRHVFQSLYVHELGGILFKLATDGPGPTFDVGPETLGESLYLPPWLKED